MTGLSRTDHLPDRESTADFTALFEEITNKLLAGHPVDLEQLVADNPHHEPSLREFFSTMKAMAELGLSASRLSSTSDKHTDADAQRLGTLGDFRIEHEIGRGGMGIVYQAQQISLDRTVALKVLPLAAILHEQQLSRFKNEAKAAARLKHPNIVSVHSVGCERGVHYYAMELIEGKSLATVTQQLRQSCQDASKVVAENGDETSAIARLSTEHSQHQQKFFQSLARIGIQAAEALQYAHEQGVVHRDVKPANLLLDSSGKLWVADFGLAQIQADQSLTISGDVLGTLRYMSPEQTSGRNVLDERTDIYSLGLSLYELATLRPAFDAADHPTLAQQVSEAQPPAPRRINSAIPSDLETIILKAINRAPDARYSTAGELADDLRRFLHHKPIHARRTSRAEHVWHWTRRNPLFSTIIGMLVVALTFLAVAGPVVAVRQTQQLKREQQQLYVARINMANEAATYGDFDRTLRLLRPYESRDRLTAHLRGFEWHYLWGRCQRRIEAPQKEWWINVYSVTYSPDGSRIAYGTWDGAVCVCRSSDFTVIWQKEGHGKATDGHADWVHAVAFSPDGSMLVSASRDRLLKLWNASTGQHLRTVELEDEPWSAAFSCDELLAVGLVRAADTNTFPSSEPTEIVTFEFKRSDQEPNEQIELQESARFGGLVGTVRSLAFSPDGDVLVAACDNSDIQRWNIESGERMPSLTGLSGPAMSVAYSPTGSCIAGGGGVYQDRWIVGEVKLWNADTGILMKSLHGHKSGVNDVAFSGDGSRLAAGSRDGQIRIWNVESGQLVDKIDGHYTGVSHLQFAPDSKWLASCGGDNCVRLWDVTGRPNNESIQAHATDVMDIAFTPDSRFLVTSSFDHEVRVWDARTGEMLRSLPTHDRGVACVALSPNGEQLVTGELNPRGDPTPSVLRLWDFNSGTLQTKRDAGDHGCVSAAYSPNGKALATTGSGKIRLWDTSSGDLTRVIDAHDAEASGLSFTADGDLLVSACSGHGQVKLWSTDTFDCLHTFEPEIKVALYGLAISPDGNTIATGGFGDNKVRLWSIPERCQIGQLVGHSDVVISVHFSPDGRRLASGSKDRTVKIWDLQTNSELITFREHDGWVWCVKFSPNGEMLASSGVGGQVCIRRAAR